MNANWKKVTATGIAAIALWSFTGCDNSASTSPEVEPMPTETAQGTEEETVNPDISPEQNAFLADLLAEPLPQDEATARIEEAGYTWRLGTIDGEPQAVTMDYRIDRLTLTVDDGLVTDATWG